MGGYPGMSHSQFLPLSTVYFPSKQVQVSRRPPLEAHEYDQYLSMAQGLMSCLPSSWWSLIGIS